MIPTTAGTGSEVTANSILTSDRLQTKKSISSPILFPKLALLDAKYMMKLPATITVNTALDALSHAIEGMLSKRSNEMSDYIALKSTKIISQCLSFLSMGRGMDAEAIPAEIRNKLLYASMLAGIVIAQTGTTAVHAMGYSLTYFKNIDHGRANALLLPGFMRFTEKSDPDAIKNILHAMTLETMDELDALFERLIGERERITMEELEQFTNISVNAKSIPNSKVVPDRDSIYKIFENGLRMV
jgi:alcohol dehydrogenase class IV